MEPRIATLLDHVSDRTTPNTLSLPSLRRPLPQPTSVGDDARSTRRSEYENVMNEHSNAIQWPTQFKPQTRGKSGVAIAEVLNDSSFESRPDSNVAFEARFSGRLSDILLVPSNQDQASLHAEQHPNKRRKVDEHGGDNERNSLKLPKLPQLPKKVSRRPRIPPLLQGLHQPPPLPPEGQLYPPITGEAGGFGRGIGERADEERNRENREGGGSGTSNGDVVAVPANDKENEVPEKGGKEVKKNKKRNKWTEQETKDLLHGVSKFGIGSWKKILECEEFSFHRRTAVDLKDRFRTCRPGDGLKARKVKIVANTETAPEDGDYNQPAFAATVNDDGAPGNASRKKQLRKPRADTHKKGAVELAEIGIQEPFVPSKRRQRREFTDKDDQNLLKGFQKYKAIWHAIRDDEDLGFNLRHPTDLRDRFRIRYPEMYQKAGFKLKPKEELLFLKEKTKTQETLSSASSQIATSKTSLPSSITSPPSNLRAHALRQPLLNSFPSLFEDFPSLDSEDDNELGSRSPITLNRDIFQWADANSSQTNAGSSYLTTGDPGFNFFAGIDSNHINPLATLKLPSASISNNIIPSREGVQRNMGISMLNTSSSMNSNATATSASTTPPSKSASESRKQTMASLLRTPNLPTIIYPHVPASSATMHNLPPPADLLSGLDLDIRTEDSARNTSHNLPPPADLLSGLDLDVGQQQHLGYFFSEGLGYASSSTLAPLVGQRGRY